MPIIPIIAIIDHRNGFEGIWVTTNEKKEALSILKKNKLGSSEIIIRKDKVELTETIRKIGGKETIIKRIIPVKYFKILKRLETENLNRLQKMFLKIGLFFQKIKIKEEIRDG